MHSERVAPVVRYLYRVFPWYMQSHSKTCSMSQQCLQHDLPQVLQDDDIARGMSW